MNSEGAASMARAAIDTDEWDKYIGEVNVDKDDLNKLLMQYFIVEGYKDVAEKFYEESKTAAEISLELLDERLYIKNLVQSGNIQDAIEKVNDLYPEILDTNQSLYFRLQQQMLIEFIRHGKVIEAIDFARVELAVYGMENPVYLEELERTMSLLALDINTDSASSYLLNYKWRQGTASILNIAILEAQCMEVKRGFAKFLNLFCWSQKMLKERLDFPTINEIEYT